MTQVTAHWPGPVTCPCPAAREPGNCLPKNTYRRKEGTFERQMVDWSETKNPVIGVDFQ